MKKIIFISLLLFLSLFVGAKMYAYQFPITQLGDCRDSQECHLYCEVSEHKPACWSYSVYGVKENVLGDEAAETKLSTLGITFPISELGNCVNLSSCKAYCSLTQNLASCQTFAKSHGLTNKEKIVEKAQTELGCNSTTECQAFCDQETNQTACKAFAQKYHLKLQTKNKLIEAAQNQLGCASLTACRQFCALPENQDKCQQFAKQYGLDTNSQREQLVATAKERLGCTSFEDCREFCQTPENVDQCQNFGQAIKEQVQQKLEERFSCDTNEECRKQCQEHPDNCPGFPNLLPGASPLLKENNLIVPPPRYKESTSSDSMTPVQKINQTEIIQNSEIPKVEESLHSTMGL